MTDKTTNKRHGHLALALLAGCLVWTGAMAQKKPDSVAPSATLATPVACPIGADTLSMQALYGHWEVTFDISGGHNVASVVLHQHPDYEGGGRGTITRAGLVAQLAGDIGDDGLLTLDESQDAVAISATWSGDLQAGSCGKEFKGIWRNTRDDSTLDFVLRKTADEK
jgi:hypothetical protein